MSSTSPFARLLVCPLVQEALPSATLSQRFLALCSFGGFPAASSHLCNCSTSPWTRHSLGGSHSSSPSLSLVPRPARLPWLYCSRKPVSERLRAETWERACLLRLSPFTRVTPKLCGVCPLADRAMSPDISTPIFCSHSLPVTWVSAQESTVLSAALPSSYPSAGLCCLLV